MATMSVAATGKPASPAITKYDRAFYTGMAVLMLLAVLVGFAPTYYAKLFGSAPMHTVSQKPFTPLVHVHGALFTGWVLLFVVQTGLVATHRVAVHRRLGIAGGVLGGAMVVAGFSTAIEAGARGSTVPGLTPQAFLAIPFFDIVMFAIFLGLALWHRRNKEAHKRLMVLGYVSILAAAVARIPGVMPLGPLGFYGFTFLFLVAAVAYDLATRRRVHPAYLWGGIALVLSVPARLALSATGAWHSFASSLIQ